MPSANKGNHRTVIQFNDRITLSGIVNDPNDWSREVRWGSGGLGVAGGYVVNAGSMKSGARVVGGLPVVR